MPLSKSTGSREPDGLRDRRQGVECGDAPFHLAAAMIRDDDAVHPGVGGPVCVSDRLDPLPSGEQM